MPSKEAQARQVLAQIEQIDQSLGAAVEQYNLANVRLRKIEDDLRENREQLRLARANLTRAQDALAARLVSAYTSTQDNSTLAVVLGSTSFEDMLNRIEAMNATAATRRKHRPAGELVQSGDPTPPSRTPRRPR